MKKQTYYKNKQQFLLNYEKIKDKYLPLNIPIDLCMEGIHGKQKFFLYFSHDVGIRGTNVVYACNSYKIYETWDGKRMSRIFPPREKGMFDIGDTFERFDQYIINRGKKK